MKDTWWIIVMRWLALLPCALGLHDWGIAIKVGAGVVRACKRCRRVRWS